MDAEQANKFAEAAKDPKMNDLLKEMLLKLREIKEKEGPVAFVEARARLILKLTKEV